MNRFFADERGVQDGVAYLSSEDSRHALRVLRLDVGDELELVCASRRYVASIEDAGEDGVRVRVREELACTEPRTQVTLYQGLPKAEKMEWIVQKATELGACAVQGVAMERCVVKLDGRDAEKKAERWQKIAREAVKQCGRSAVPDVLPAIPFSQALERMKRHERLLMPYENGGMAFGAPIAERDVALLIGPEGGISPEEAEAVRGIGGTAVTLGSRILRTETAGLVALTLTLHCAGDLGGMA